VVVDDVEWAGGDAREMLEGVVGAAQSQAPLRVLGAYRDTEVAQASPLEHLLADLARDGLAERVAVGPLAPAEAAAFLEHLLAERARALAPLNASGSAPGWAEWRVRLLERTGGVPYSLESCVRAHAAGATEEVPWDVAQSIRLRVADLPVPTQELLGAAAVVGRTVPCALLLALADQPEQVVLAALKVAHHAKLLVRTARDAYALAHDLVREAVEAALSTGQRKALHRRVAVTLERAAPTEHAEELADHFTRGGQPERALPYALRAGDQAEAVYAHSEAEQHY